MLVKKNSRKHNFWYYGMGCEKRGGFNPISLAFDAGSVLLGAKDIYKAATHDAELVPVKFLSGLTARIIKNRERDAEEAVNKMRQIVSGEGIQVY